MLMGGHGAVVWAEKWVPSGLTSVLIATVPLWMVLMDSLRSRSRPGVRVVAGFALGFAGVALLVDSPGTLGGGGLDALGAGIIVGGAFLWACGSLYSRSGKLPSSPLQATSLEMLTGGTLLLLASGVVGEWTRMRLDQVSTVSMVSWLYLIVFGSLVAFTSYIWLLKQTTPEHVSTYAYVNPIVAMILGATLASETLTTQNVLATVVVLASVVVITTRSPAQAPERKTHQVASDGPRLNLYMEGKGIRERGLGRSLHAFEQLVNIPSDVLAAVTPFQNEERRFPQRSDFLPYFTVALLSQAERGEVACMRVKSS